MIMCGNDVFIYLTDFFVTVLHFSIPGEYVCYLIGGIYHLINLYVTTRGHILRPVANIDDIVLSWALSL